MKKVFIVLLIISSLSSCSLLVPDRWIDDNEPERFYFSLRNKGTSTYSYALVYAKDNNKMIIDSSHRENYQPGYDHNVFNVPNSEGVGVSIDIPKLMYISNGTFEVEAKLLEGKVFRHEFGSIKNPSKSQHFVIEFRDSTITIK